MDSVSMDSQGNAQNLFKPNAFLKSVLNQEMQAFGNFMLWQSLVLLQ